MKANGRQNGEGVGTKRAVEVDVTSYHLLQIEVMVASPTLDYCQLALWIAIITLSLVVLSRLFRNCSKRFCLNIPLIPNNSIWGYVDLLATSTKEHSERSILATVERYGQLSQFRCFHHHVVLVNDSKMATLALEKVHGRGFFNAGVMPSSAVGEQSPACVDLLTRAFAHAEGTAETLDTIRRYSSQACSILEDASTADRLPLDATDLFHKLSFDVLGALLFRFDMQALGDSDLYNDLKLHYDRVLQLQRSAPMVASYNLLSKAGLQWLYPPFQLCEASVTTIKSFQLMMLKQIQTDCLDLHHCSDEIIMDAVLSSFQFGLFVGATLTSFLRALVQHPDIQAKYRDSISRSSCCHIGAKKAVIAPHDYGESKQASEFSHSPSDDMEELHDMVHRLPRDFYNFLDDSPLEIRGDIVGGSGSDVIPEDDPTDNHKVRIARKPSLPPYIEAVLKESMRRYPAAPISVMRLVTDPRGFTIPKAFLISKDEAQCCDSDDIVVPKGSWVLINALALHHAAAQWGPDALSFEPERWLSDEECTESWASPKSSSTASAEDVEYSETLPELSPTPVAELDDGDSGMRPISSKGVVDSSVLDVGEYLDDSGSGGATSPNVDGVRASEELCFTPLSLALREFSALELAMDVVRVVIADIAQKGLEFIAVPVDGDCDEPQLMVRVRGRREK